MTDGWTTYEDLADYMDVDELYVTSAELAIGAAEQAVRKYLDQHITLVTDDIETHDGNGRIRLRLRERPIREVTAVFEDGTELDAEAYVLDKSVLKRVDGYVWARGVQNIEVEYTHGWDGISDLLTSEGMEFAFPVPADIRLVTLNIARRTFSSQGEQTDITLTGETIGQYSYTRDGTAAQETDASSLLLAEKTVLDRYRIHYAP